MFGTIVNFFAIILGSLIGILFHKRINQDIAYSLFKVLGLCVIYLGIIGLIKVENPMVIILSMALGTLLGEVINIEKKLETMSNRIEMLVNKYYKGKIKDGFLTATLLFCIGSMAIIGTIESTLSNNHATLYAKSILDGITSVIFASTMGLGVMLSSFSVLLYQGSISVLANFIKPLVTAVPETIPMISGVGSLMIMGLGINMVFNLKLKISNMLPSILIPIFYAMGLFLWNIIQ
ncbi:DUF554 domain-containing protein [Proteiniclasticum sp. SCR006]|uniref:DUF554 domain-containing protein n=1 Tax=Proteiniclasticum aestuarii TaxID=2817862 RepID=A0A939KKI1_9CLOT|nr:DUF554 domain-containing protein [Proteiniclasticum aestuarii]MBO1266131.1 DUF554 domain-containing protein [Proteiniclasticum aestuarii]